MALVCGGGHYRSALPLPDCGRDGARDRHPFWTMSGSSGMAKPPTVASPVTDIADAVGLAGSAVGHRLGGEELGRRVREADPLFRRDAYQGGTGDEVWRGVVGVGSRHIRRVGA